MYLSKQIEHALKKEIEKGYMGLQEDGMMHANISLSAVELMGTYLHSILKKQLYHFPTPEAYRDKIKELFGIVFNAKSTMLYDQGVGEVEPKTVFIQSDEVVSSILLTNKGFITLPFRLPELINYQKYFPYLRKIEDEMKKPLEKEEDETLILWRDIVGNEEEYEQSIVDNLYYIIRLNNYLFNREKKYLDWLFEKKPFLEMLVSTYGYNADIQLIEKIMDSREVDEHFCLNDLIWFKGAKRVCGMEEEPLYNGEFRIQHNTFKVIYNKLKGQKFHVPTQNVYLKALHRILVEQLDEEDILTKKEKEEIKSYIIDFLDDFLLDSSNLESLQNIL